MTTPKSNPSKHYKHFRKAVAFRFRKLELCRHCRFRAGSFSGLSPRIQVLAHMPCWPPWSFCPKQLRLPVLNETHTNICAGPRLKAQPVLESKIRVGIKTIIIVRLVWYKRCFVYLHTECSQLTVNYAEDWNMSKTVQYLLQKKSWNRFMQKR